MFVPFVFSLSSINDVPYLWWFYKSLDFSLRNNSATIAQEIYCKTPVSKFAADGYQVAYVQGSADRFGYRLPKNQDLKKARLYTIPDNLIGEIVNEKGSITNAFCYLLTQIDGKFLCFLESVLEQIERECNEKIEGFITLSSIPTLIEAAHLHGIPVIQKLYQ